MTVVVLEDVRRSLEQRVAPYVRTRGKGRRAQPDDARAVRGLLATVDDLSRFQPVEPRRAAATLILLAVEVPVVLALVGSGKTEQAAKFVLQIWRTSASGAARFRKLAASTLNMSPAVAESAKDWKRVLTQVAAAQSELVERLREIERSERVEYSIPLLMKTLDLSYNEVGRILGVNGETVRRWADGSVRVPPEQLAKIDQAASALQRLLGMMKPARLAEIIRRPADAFGGERALQWILAGRIQDVADVYERMLARRRGLDWLHRVKPQ